MNRKLSFFIVLLLAVLSSICGCTYEDVNLPVQKVEVTETPAPSPTATPYITPTVEPIYRSEPPVLTIQCNNQEYRAKLVSATWNYLKDGQEIIMNASGTLCKYEDRYQEKIIYVNENDIIKLNFDIVPESYTVYLWNIYDLCTDREVHVENNTFIINNENPSSCIYYVEANFAQGYVNYSFIVYSFNNSVRVVTRDDEFTAYESPHGYERRYTHTDGTTGSDWACFMTKAVPDGGYYENLKYINADEFQSVEIIGEIDRDVTYYVYKIENGNLNFTELECVMISENHFIMPSDSGKYLVKFSISFILDTYIEEETTVQEILTNVYYFGLIVP